MSETKGEIPVGPELDRAVGELMGAEPLHWCGIHAKGFCACRMSTRERALAILDVVEAEPVYAAYSTSSAWEQVADWLVEQGWYVTLLNTVKRKWRALLKLELGTVPLEGFGATRAEAVCRAALRTQEGKG